MTDFAGFAYGNVVYPLPLSGSGLGGAGATFLRDADPPLFYILEFAKSCLETHVGLRTLAEAATAGCEQITAVVADVLPLNPAPYLIESHFKFPLLSAYRKTTKFEWMGQSKIKVDEVELTYTLPPLQAGEAERMMPLMEAVVSILDNRIEQGFDPAYAPSQPTGTAGERWWTRAGVVSAGLSAVTYGGFMAEESLYYPAAIMTLTLKTRSSANLAELEMLGDALVNIDVADDTEPTVADVVQFYIDAEPTLTLASPNSGTKAGGTLVTLTGTNFHSHLEPTILFGGVAATNVVVISETTIQCRTPAYNAFPTSIVDVNYEDNNGLTARLVAGYSFTTP